MIGGIEELLVRTQSRVYEVCSLRVRDMIGEEVLTPTLSGGSGEVDKTSAYLVILKFPIWTRIMQLCQSGGSISGRQKRASSVDVGRYGIRIEAICLDLA